MSAANPVIAAGRSVRLSVGAAVHDVHTLRQLALATMLEELASIPAAPLPDEVLAYLTETAAFLGVPNVPPIAKLGAHYPYPFGKKTWHLRIVRTATHLEAWVDGKRAAQHPV